MAVSIGNAPEAVHTVLVTTTVAKSPKFAGCLQKGYRAYAAGGAGAPAIVKWTAAAIGCIRGFRTE